MKRTTNWIEDDQVKCPFYNRSTIKVIVCESPSEYSETQTSLYVTPAGNRNNYMNKYCRGLWEECPIARDVKRKYEERENP